MSESEGHPQNESNRQQAAHPPLVVRTEELFQGQREICIEHEGQHYRLRITRRNKLILQK